MTSEAARAIVRPVTSRGTVAPFGRRSATTVARPLAVRRRRPTTSASTSTTATTASISRPTTLARPRARRHRELRGGRARRWLPGVVGHGSGLFRPTTHVRRQRRGGQTSPRPAVRASGSRLGDRAASLRVWRARSGRRPAGHPLIYSSSRTLRDDVAGRPAGSPCENAPSSSTVKDWVRAGRRGRSSDIPPGSSRPAGGPMGRRRSGRLGPPRSTPAKRRCVTFGTPPLQSDAGRRGTRARRHGKAGEDSPRGPAERRVDDASGELVATSSPLDRGDGARGGRGGLGNTISRRPPPGAEHAERRAREERSLRLELRLIADVGCFGLPNSGKSTISPA